MCDDVYGQIDAEKTSSHFHVLSLCGGVLIGLAYEGQEQHPITHSF